MAASKAEQAAPKKEKQQLALPADSINLGLLGVTLLALAVSLFFGWQALFQPATSDLTATPTATASATPAVPTPILNHSYQRQGEPVIVDQSLIGRDNPFK
jgi:hypothetical protein